jgi:predicted O-linked N-acetylglucosamine transferase (SPINDLY family)
MALRPAPIAMTYLGYPDTTGLEAINYRITDALADPPGTGQRFTEELLRLPRCFLCYTPSGEAPEVGPLPGRERGYVTFACFNTLAKVNDGVLDVWARLLAEVPGARLLLKSKGFANPRVVARLAGRLSTRGVDPARIECVPLVAETRDHLATYGRADVALDTFPYAGTTTTCEALLMGVPVVTLSGASHAHNVGRSLLDAAGLPELTAGSADEYVAIARRLAADAPHLAELRRSLRERLLRSPLCDGVSFTRALESLYEQALARRGARAGA